MNDISALEGVAWKYDLTAGRHVHVDPRITPILGFSPEDWIGKDWQFRLSHVHPDDRARVRQASGEILWHTGKGDLEYRFRAHDGSYVRFRETITMVGDWETSRLALVISVPAESAAPAELSPVTLQTQKLESIGMLAGGIAHDFNNILGAILGFAELAASHTQVREDAKLASYISEIRKGGVRGRDLVKQLMSFSRATEADPASIDPIAMLNDFFSFIRATVPATYELRLSLPQHLPAIVADTAQLHQVLLNLALNARDAQPGKGLIAFSASLETCSVARCASCQEAFSGQFLCLAVSDAGSGLGAVDIPGIFEPFFTTRKSGQGTGLGLSIVHRIVHSHAGHIQASASTEGGGEFRLYLPLANQPVAAPQPLPAPAGSCGLTGRVMLVDDDPTVLFVMEEMLRSLGCEVEVFPESAAAMRAIAALKDAPEGVGPDLLLTDLAMPLHDGIELIRALRAVDPQCPSLLMTGYSRRVDAAVLDELDIGVLHKPIDLDQLGSALGQHLPATRRH